MPVDEVRAQLEQEWDEVVAGLAASLDSGAYLVPPPPPHRWPHYQKARLRALKGGLAAYERAGGAGPASSGNGQGGGVYLEKAVASADGRLVGRVDRVERSADALRIVDLKSGFDGSEEVPERYREQLLLYAFMWHEATGEWPTECAIESPTGVRVGMVPSVQEVEGAASDALALLDEYNGHAGQSAENLATPSEEACQWCDFRVACPAFFEEVDVDWATYGRRFVRGKVVPDPVGGSRVLAVEVAQGNLPESVEVARVLLPAEADLDVTEGEQVALASGLRASADGDVGVDWRTQLCVWP